MNAQHYRQLEAMYASAPINQHPRPALTVREREATVLCEASPGWHHAAGAVHGSLYFKLLDDAAFFAAQSLVEDVFVLTASFNVELYRPVVSGLLRAEGEISKPGRSLIFASAKLFGPDGALLASGTGTFARSRIPLGPQVGYRP